MMVFVLWKPGCYFQIRFLVAFLIFLAVTLQYAMKANMSVAIEDMDLPSHLKGHILSAYYYGYISTQLPGGVLAHWLGGRVIVGPALLATALFGVLIPVTRESVGVGAIIAARVFQGASSGVVIPALHVTFSQWFPEHERSRYSAFVFSAVHLGSVVGMSVSGAAIEEWGWPSVFYTFAVVVALWFLLWTYLVRDTPDKHPFISRLELVYILQGTKSEAVGVDRRLSSFRGTPWTRILASQPVWASILMQFGQLWLSFTLLSELPNYMRGVLKKNIRKAGLLSALPYLWAWVGGIAWGFISQALRSAGVLSHKAAYRLFNGITAVGPSAALLAVTWVEGTVGTEALFCTAMLCSSALYGGSYFNHVYLAPRHVGALSGLGHTVVNVAGIAAPLVASAFTAGAQDPKVGWRYVFLTGAAVTLSTFFLYLALGSVEEQPWNREATEQSPQAGRQAPGKTLDDPEVAAQGPSQPAMHHASP